MRRADSCDICAESEVWACGEYEGRSLHSTWAQVGETTGAKTEVREKLWFTCHVCSLGPMRRVSGDRDEEVGRCQVWKRLECCAVDGGLCGVLSREVKWPDWWLQGLTVVDTDALSWSPFNEGSSNLRECFRPFGDCLSRSEAPQWSLCPFPGVGRGWKVPHPVTDEVGVWGPGHLGPTRTTLKGRLTSGAHCGVGRGCSGACFAAQLLPLPNSASSSALATSAFLNSDLGEVARLLHWCSGEVLLRTLQGVPLEAGGVPIVSCRKHSQSGACLTGPLSEGWHPCLPVGVLNCFPYFFQFSSCLQKKVISGPCNYFMVRREVSCSILSMLTQSCSVCSLHLLNTIEAEGRCSENKQPERMPIYLIVPGHSPHTCPLVPTWDLVALLLTEEPCKHLSCLSQTDNDAISQDGGSLVTHHSDRIPNARLSGLITYKGTHTSRHTGLLPVSCPWLREGTLTNVLKCVPGSWELMVLFFLFGFMIYRQVMIVL